MKNHKFHIEADRAAAHFRIIESELLESTAKAERYLTKLENFREAVAQQRKIRQEQLANVVEDPSAERARHILRGKIQELDTKLAKAEKDLVDRWDTIRRGLQKYLASKKRFEASCAAQVEIAEEAQDAGAQGDGMGLMGQLGMALFALKTSNAFDDLAKLSGRK